jgi:squalene-hopene/tetraprenyl-beta-curcumene cyclase
MAWPPATRDHGTFCISCHTALPYALARPALRAALGEEAPSQNERRLLESVNKRVRLWNEVKPFYTESSGARKTLQSRGTESILNALILASADARNGKLSDDTRAAFDYMWALQGKTGDQKGAWPWLDFGNEPFEATDSQYYGASLAAVAVGTAPENYRATPEIQNNLKLLGDYVRRESSHQALIHQVVSLWAATKWPGLLAPAQQRSIIDDVLGRQQSDGGWGLSSLGWTWRGLSLHSLVNLWIRSNDTPLAGKSDGYATGLIVFVLGQAGVPHDDAHLQRGRSWLVRNQNQSEGLWPGYSLVNRRDPSSGTGRFMNDAATAYAVLALTASDGP